MLEELAGGMGRLQLGGSEEVTAFVAVVIGRSRCSWNGASLLDADSIFPEPLTSLHLFVFFVFTYIRQHEDADGAYRLPDVWQTPQSQKNMRSK